MIGKLDKVRGTATVGGPLRSVGRVALWAVVVLFLFRGAVSVFGSNEVTPEASLSGTAKTTTDSQAVDAFAVRYARAYLADSSPLSIGSLLASGADSFGGGGPSPTDTHVAQAEATATKELSDNRQLVTVSCELVNGHVVFLAVPIVRDQAGGVAADGAPAFVSAPGIGRVEVEAEKSLPIPGVDAEEVRDLASRFVEAYLSATDPADLEYLTSPASTIVPLGEFQAVGKVRVTQLGNGAGLSRTVLASVNAQSATGTTYPLSYRLQLEKRDRWYVAAVEGEVR